MSSCSTSCLIHIGQPAAKGKKERSNSQPHDQPQSVEHESDAPRQGRRHPQRDQGQPRQPDGSAGHPRRLPGDVLRASSARPADVLANQTVHDPDVKEQGSQSDGQHPSCPHVESSSQPRRPGANGSCLAVHSVKRRLPGVAEPDIDTNLAGFYSCLALDTLHLLSERRGGRDEDPGPQWHDRHGE